MNIDPGRQSEEGLFADVRRRYAKNNQLLLGHDSVCLQELQDDMLRQNHRTLVLWALDCAQDALKRLEARYPDDPRPREAVTLCRQWAQGAIKMPPAKHAILAMHAMAKETDNIVDASLCHALGHACATVHTEKHAIGLPVYELTALVRALGINSVKQALPGKIAYYRQHLAYWQEEVKRYPGPWAIFLLHNEDPGNENLYLTN